MNKTRLLALVQSHTKYDVQCECGEFLLKRENGFMSSRDQWELHFAAVLNEALQEEIRQSSRVHQDRT